MGEKSHAWKVIHSSDRQNWRTPSEFFEQLNEIFRFQLDVASDGDNALCRRYYTPEDDALKQSWNAGEGEWAWCNPPYGRGLKNWIHKAVEESKLGARVVVLAFACTDTQWFKEAWSHAREIWFFSGRIKFTDPDNPDAKKAPAPKGSALYVFDGHTKSAPIIRLCGLGGNGWATPSEMRTQSTRYRIMVE